MNKLHLGVVGSLVILTACGGSVVAGGAGGHGTGAGTTGTGAGTTGTGAGTTGTGASTTGTGASTGTGGGVSSSPCPPNQPTGGESCAGAPAQFQCTYGDSVRPECRTPWICNAGTWETTGSTCVTPTDCGATEPSTPTVCANMGDVCTYGDSICFCGCGGGPACLPPPNWNCAAPPTTPGCPAVVPNDGTPCSAAGVQCTYGVQCTSSNAVVNCTNGLWIWDTMIGCAEPGG